MTTQETELYRECILMQLNATRVATRAIILKEGLKYRGFETNDIELESELGYLKDRGLISIKYSPLGGEKSYSISEMGIKAINSI